MANARIERAEDLFLIEVEDDPTEDGLVRHVDGEIRAYIDGQLVRMNQPIIRRELLGNLIVRTGTTVLWRDMVVPVGMSVTIEGTGELMMLGSGGDGGGGGGYYEAHKTMLVFG